MRAAIQEGAHIIPAYFFGNTRLYSVPGNDPSSWLSELSRRFRASVVFFYGRFFSPVPYRHPLRFVSGDIVEVKQCDNPTDEQIDETMARLVKSVQTLYDSKKPDWETRPLVIT